MDQSLQMCREWVKRQAYLAGGLRVLANGERVLGQLCCLWQVSVPSCIRRWLPDGEDITIKFLLTHDDLHLPAEELAARLQERWLMAMMSLWEAATQDIQKRWLDRVSQEEAEPSKV